MVIEDSVPPTAADFEKLCYREDAGEDRDTRILSRPLVEWNEGNERCNN